MGMIILILFIYLDTANDSIKIATNDLIHSFYFDY